MVRPKGPRNEHAEPVAQGLLGDLLDHEERGLQRDTGLALQRGELGVWLVGEAGALLVSPGGRRVHCFCVRTTEPELPPSDRVAHLPLALRVEPRLRGRSVARAPADAGDDAPGSRRSPPGRALASPPC